MDVKHPKGKQVGSLLPCQTSQAPSFHPGLAALPYSPHPHSGPRIHSRREAPASSSEAATSLIFCCPQMRSPVKLALSTPVPSSKHHPHPAAHSLSWSAHHRGTCSRLFFTALFSGLINIDGRAGSRVALLGDNLSGRRVRVSGWSCNGTPGPDSRPPCLPPPHLTLAYSGLGVGFKPEAPGSHPERHTCSSFLRSLELVTRGLSFGVPRERQGHQDVLEWLGEAPWPQNQNPQFSKVRELSPSSSACDLGQCITPWAVGPHLPSKQGGQRGATTSKLSPKYTFLGGRNPSGGLQR